eukprot:1150319-Pelagomonas_calceolata.AAC.2
MSGHFQESNTFSWRTQTKVYSLKHPLRWWSIHGENGTGPASVEALPQCKSCLNARPASIQLDPITALRQHGVRTGHFSPRQMLRWFEAGSIANEGWTTTNHIYTHMLQVSSSALTRANAGVLVLDGSTFVGPGIPSSKTRVQQLHAAMLSGIIALDRRNPQLQEECAAILQVLHRNHSGMGLHCLQRYHWTGGVCSYAAGAAQEQFRHGHLLLTTSSFGSEDSTAAGRGILELPLQLVQVNNMEDMEGKLLINYTETHSRPPAHCTGQKSAQTMIPVCVCRNA